MSKEEIEFLREHIEGICRYKGLQQELTYDVSLDVLQRICLALDYLQEENTQLKIQLLEKKCSDKDIEYKEKIKLQQRIDKAIKYIEENSPNLSNSELYDLLEILKGEDNE